MSHKITLKIITCIHHPEYLWVLSLLCLHLEFHRMPSYPPHLIHENDVSKRVTDWIIFDNARRGYKKNINIERELNFNHRLNGEKNRLFNVSDEIYEKRRERTKKKRFNQLKFQSKVNFLSSRRLFRQHINSLPSSSKIYT